MAAQVIITLPIEGPTSFVLQSQGQPNPYKDGEEKMDIYKSEDGRLEVWTEAGDVSRVIQAGPGAGLHHTSVKVAKAKRLEVPEMRARAVRVATKAVEGYPLRLSELHPLEDHKDREIYFFRWDDFTTRVRDSEMPPFVQVALYADGRLASYTDTLARSTKQETPKVATKRTFTVTITLADDSDADAEQILNKTLTQVLDNSDDVAGWSLSVVKE